MNFPSWTCVYKIIEESFKIFCSCLNITDVQTENQTIYYKIIFDFNKSTKMTIVNKFIGYMFHNQVTVPVCKINFRYFEEMNIKGKYTHYGKQLSKIISSIGQNIWWFFKLFHWTSIVLKFEKQGTYRRLKLRSDFLCKGMDYMCIQIQWRVNISH